MPKERKQLWSKQQVAATEILMLQDSVRPRQWHRLLVQNCYAQLLATASWYCRHLVGHKNVYLVESKASSFVYQSCCEESRPWGPAPPFPSELLWSWSFTANPCQCQAAAGQQPHPCSVLGFCQPSPDRDWVTPLPSVNLNLARHLPWALSDLDWCLQPWSQPGIASLGPCW